MNHRSASGQWPDANCWASLVMDHAHYVDIHRFRKLSGDIRTVSQCDHPEKAETIQEITISLSSRGVISFDINWSIRNFSFFKTVATDRHFEDRLLGKSVWFPHSESAREARRTSFGHWILLCWALLQYLDYQHTGEDNFSIRANITMGLTDLEYVWQKTQTGRCVISDITSSVLTALLEYEYVYCGFSEDDIGADPADILLAADTYQVSDLAKRYERFLMGQVAVKNVVDLVLYS
ncbi:hypothetical protein RvY_16580 [Ramazzottius varieornatus]|uniref:Uncharacterized protein n=1 Tax=Ramazzottius varieornatus TaxID=947166 RepID=A0A1D1W5C7_RAMVA|nr:hypothetical protein RvY_16580 [Ramazzottius varieornatus]